MVSACPRQGPTEITADLHDSLRHAVDAYLSDHAAQLEVSLGLQMRQHSDELHRALNGHRQEILALTSSSLVQGLGIERDARAEMHVEFLDLVENLDLELRAELRACSSRVDSEVGRVADRLPKLERNLNAALADKAEEWSKASQAAREAIEEVDASLQAELVREHRLVESLESDLGNLREALSIMRAKAIVHPPQASAGAPQARCPEAAVPTRGRSVEAPQARCPEAEEATNSAAASAANSAATLVPEFVVYQPEAARRQRSSGSPGPRASAVTNTSVAATAVHHRTPAVQCSPPARTRAVRLPISSLSGDPPKSPQLESRALRDLPYLPWQALQRGVPGAQAAN